MVAPHSNHELKNDKRRALGKGLESLLPSRPVTGATVPEAASGSGSEAGGHPREIPVELIERNPFQTRARVDESHLEELARSITANGVVQPIIVRQLPNGHFQLIAGERRWMASQIAGKTTVPAVVRQVSDEQAMEMTIIENLQRADLNPIEQARAFERLSKEFKMTQEQMSIRTGMERGTIANFVRLLKLPLEVQTKIETGELSFGHGKILLALESADAILNAMVRVTALSMSVRQTESYVQGILNPEKRTQETKGKPAQDPNVHEAQLRLQQALGLKVRIEDKQGKGRVVIEYSGLEDFDALMAALGQQV